HPVVGYKKQFHLPIAMCGESRRRISEAQGAVWQKKGKHWTRDRVLAEIRQRAQSPRSLQKRCVPQPLYSAAGRFFGTWEAGIGKAGLDYEATRAVRRWTRMRIIERIRDLADKDEPLNTRHIKMRHATLYRAAIRRFPKSWGKALRAAGFNPDEHRVPLAKWNRSTAESWVRERVARKKPLAAHQAPSKLFAFVRAQLRLSWADFVESLGIEDHGIQRKRQWTK